MRRVRGVAECSAPRPSMATTCWMCPLISFALLGYEVAFAATNSADVAALRSLMSEWEMTPPTWDPSNDPCGPTAWTGVICADSRVVSLELSSMNLQGTLHPAIAQLTNLETLDLSFNRDLGGELTPNIGNLKKLRTMILAGCSFTGNIPEEMGNLTLLEYLALNSNKFVGEIPASIGSLSNLKWLDISENQLSGSLPISNATTSGLDKLWLAQHFCFSKNRLSNDIPSEIFHSNMSLLSILLDGNQLSGKIPGTIERVPTLEVVRLDQNQLQGSIPSAVGNLTSVRTMHLSDNHLTGDIPDLHQLKNINYLDLSKNSFSLGWFPDWVTDLTSLTTLVLDSCNLAASITDGVFSLPQLQKVSLKNNGLWGTLDLTVNVSQQLRLVDLVNNMFASAASGKPDYVTLLLRGNPVCEDASTVFLQNACRQYAQKEDGAYSTSMGKCSYVTCPSKQSATPKSCRCVYPYQGNLVFKAPRFSDLTNATPFQQLQTTLCSELGLACTLQNVIFTDDGYLRMTLSLFPSNVSSIYFKRTEIQRLGFSLANRTYNPPEEFGTYVFLASPYIFPDQLIRQAGLSTAVKGGTAALSFIMLLLIILLVYFIVKKKKKKQYGSVQQFSFKQISKMTNRFAEGNKIGQGSFGKVYKAKLPKVGTTVAVKRSLTKSNKDESSTFKNEIKLLSRIHHRNLVKLVGFCCEKKEEILVYEFISNGNLEDILTEEKDGNKLDWIKRLEIALDSAKGLHYLHEGANPPVIHRDIKPANILLDDTLTAKIADFGISKSLPDFQQSCIRGTRVGGSGAYLDPEYGRTKTLTKKSDVYSFGVVMLELIGLELSYNTVPKFKVSFEEANNSHRGLKDIMDVPLIGTNDQLPGFDSFVHLAYLCIKDSSKDRPSIDDVVKKIELIKNNASR